jgi:hypothetical protein
MYWNKFEAEKGNIEDLICYLKSGDKIRFDDTSIFKKGAGNRWIDELLVVQSATGP